MSEELLKVIVGKPRAEDLEHLHAREVVSHNFFKAGVVLVGYIGLYRKRRCF
jgi:hypothetical protein